MLLDVLARVDSRENRRVITCQKQRQQQQQQQEQEQEQEQQQQRLASPTLFTRQFQLARLSANQSKSLFVFGRLPQTVSRQVKTAQ
jgi:hypothetical protein